MRRVSSLNKFLVRERRKERKERNGGKGKGRKYSWRRAIDADGTARGVRSFKICQQTDDSHK